MTPSNTTQRFREDMIRAIERSALASENMAKELGELKTDIKAISQNGCQRGAVHESQIDQIKTDNQNQYNSISTLNKQVATLRAVTNGPKRAAAGTSAAVSGGIGVFILILAKLKEILSFFNGGQ